MDSNLNDEQMNELRKIIPSPNSGQIFSYKVCEMLLKEEEKSFIHDFYTDGSDDRGVDFVYLRCNNKTMPYADIIEKLENDYLISSLEINVFQCKSINNETTSISEVESDKLLSLISTINNSCNSAEEIIANDRLRKFVNFLKNVYNYQHKIQDFYFEINYISTVYDFDEFQSEKVKNDIGRNIENEMHRKFSKVKIAYNVYSKVTLPQLYAKYFSYERFLLNFTQSINDEDGLIGLIDANNFFKCITNSQSNDIGQYIKNFDVSIFEVNVRSFLGSNKVNKDIIRTCQNIVSNTRKGFWVFNNGITILCENYLLNPNGVLQIYDLKVINGLQTICSVMKFLSENRIIKLSDLEKIKFNIKIITKENMSDKEIEEVIVSTNAQSQVKYQELICIDNDLKILEFKLYDDKIDYMRKKKQKKKKGCNIQIMNNVMLQLIITCFYNGPSNAKNKLEESLYPKDENNEKKLIDFKPYWNTNKYGVLKQAIVLYDKLVVLQKQYEKSVKKDKDKAIIDRVQVLKYAKLHIVYYYIKLSSFNSLCDDMVLISVDNMYKIFELYNQSNVDTLNIERLSKSITIQSIFQYYNVIKNEKESNKEPVH